MSRNTINFRATSKKAPGSLGKGAAGLSNVWRIVGSSNDKLIDSQSMVGKHRSLDQIPQQKAAESREVF